jgi:hypothetical protein
MKSSKQIKNRCLTKILRNANFGKSGKTLLLNDEDVLPTSSSFKLSEKEELPILYGQLDAENQYLISTHNIYAYFKNVNYFIKNSEIIGIAEHSYLEEHNKISDNSLILEILTKTDSISFLVESGSAFIAVITCIHTIIDCYSS